MINHIKYYKYKGLNVLELNDVLNIIMLKSTTSKSQVENIHFKSSVHL